MCVHKCACMCVSVVCLVYGVVCVVDSTMSCAVCRVVCLCELCVSMCVHALCVFYTVYMCVLCVLCAYCACVYVLHCMCVMLCVCVCVRILNCVCCMFCNKKNNNRVVSNFEKKSQLASNNLDSDLPTLNSSRHIQLPRKYFAIRNDFQCTI